MPSATQSVFARQLTHSPAPGSQTWESGVQLPASAVQDAWQPPCGPFEAAQTFPVPHWDVASQPHAPPSVPSQTGYAPLQPELSLHAQEGKALPPGGATQLWPAGQSASTAHEPQVPSEQPTVKPPTPHSAGLWQVHCFVDGSQCGWFEPAQSASLRQPTQAPVDGSQVGCMKLVWQGGAPASMRQSV